MNEKKLDMNKVDSRLAKMYTFKGDKQEQYDLWADRYESDLVNDLDYVAHLRASEVFAAVVTDRNARILDMGCGTGLVGETLQELGYHRIDGADFSAEMLKIAEKRGVYGAVRQQDVTQPMVLTQPYDALISVGLFSYGVPHISDLHNAVNCVLPGGLCVITVNGSAWTEHDMEKAFNQETAEHGFTVENIVETDYIRGEAITAKVLVIRR